MPGIAPGIHVLNGTRKRKAWMAGARPAMTVLNTSMRVLAIDTALEACAAAVLDTGSRRGRRA